MVRVRIFPAKRKHIAHIDEINQECLPEHYPEEYWQEVISKHISWIAVINNKIVGYIICDKMIDDNEQLMSDQYLIISTAVLPDFRRIGCAKKLLQEALKELKLIKAKVLYLQVRKSNLPAQSLYEKMGFVIDQELPDYYIDPEEDGLKMKKILLND